MTPQSLYQWRKARGLTLDDAAEQLGVSRRWYCYAEAGTNAYGKTVDTIPPRIELAVLKLERVSA